MLYFHQKGTMLQLLLVAKGSLMIGRKKLVDSLFDEEIQKKDGFILKKPKEWL